MKKTSSILFSIYLIFIFFYGIFVKILYKTSLLDLLKFVPETLLLFFIISLCFRYKIKMKKVDFAILCLLVSIYIMGMINSFELSSFMIACRDFLIPLLSFIFLKNMSIRQEEKNKYYSILVFICILFLAISTIIGFLEYTKGWQFTSKFYTGHVFYGKDDRSSLIIKTAGNHVRAFGVLGDSAKYGFYILISFCILNFKKCSLKKIIITFMICFINILFTTNKTSMVLLLVLFLYLSVVQLKIKNKKIVFALLGLIGIIAALMVFNSPEEFQSIAIRLYMWKNNDLYSIRNMVLGFDLYSYFGHPELWTNILDNTYLFGMAAFGIASYILVLAYLIKQLYKNSTLSNSLLLIFLIGGITTNMFSGRSFFSVFCFICGLLFCDEKINTVQRRSRYENFNC